MKIQLQEDPEVLDRSPESSFMVAILFYSGPEWFANFRKGIKGTCICIILNLGQWFKKSFKDISVFSSDGYFVQWRETICANMVVAIYEEHSNPLMLSMSIHSAYHVLQF